MKTTLFTALVLGALLSCSTTKANVLYVEYANDGDGAINCDPGNWQGDAPEASLNISGIQFWGPAHLVGTIQTDSTPDPSLYLSSSINNDTAFTWTAYMVNVYMNSTFTISGAGVSVPGDWSTATTQPTWNGTQYEGQILFSSGTPVLVGSQLDFAYTISFGSATSYTFTQEMIPVPEPGTLGFLATGALLLGGILKAGGRRLHS